MDYIYHAFSISFAKKPEIVLSREHSAYQWAFIEEAKQLPLMQGAIRPLSNLE